MRNFKDRILQSYQNFTFKQIYMSDILHIYKSKTLYYCIIVNIYKVKKNFYALYSHGTLRTKFHTLTHGDTMRI